MFWGKGEGRRVRGAEQRQGRGRGERAVVVILPRQEGAVQRFLGSGELAGTVAPSGSEVRGTKEQAGRKTGATLHHQLNGKFSSRIPDVSGVWSSRALPIPTGHWQLDATVQKRMRCARWLRACGGCRLRRVRVRLLLLFAVSSAPVLPPSLAQSHSARGWTALSRRAAPPRRPCGPRPS